MTIRKPNRTRVQSSDHGEESRRKESGDQHTLPLDEPALDPHRPHRVSRDDMQKTLPEGAAPDEAGSKR